jgi:hypothetical protein
MEFNFSVADYQPDEPEESVPRISVDSLDKMATHESPKIEKKQRSITDFFMRRSATQPEVPVEQEASRVVRQDTKTPVQPLIQSAQKCAWCGDYLLGDEPTAVYDGANPLYVNWECHDRCNVYSTQEDFVDLEAQQISKQDEFSQPSKSDKSDKRMSMSTVVFNMLLGEDDS